MPIATITWRKDDLMKSLLLKIARLACWPQRRSLEEQYLARAVDAHDFEVRQRALERARP